MHVKEILKKYGIGPDQMVEAAFALFEGTQDGRSVEELKQSYIVLLEHNLQDPNIALLMEAAAHLDEVVSRDSGCIFQGADDPEALVADELIGMSVAEYIAGKKGLFNYIRYDREKPGIIANLPPFMDDAIGALVAATMTKLFE